MVFFYICLVLFFLMLSAPLLIGFGELYRKESKALYIDLERKRDIRYFSNAFTNMIEKALETYKGDGYLDLSKKEKIYYIDSKTTFKREYDSLVLATDNNLFIGKNTKFKKEIYARHNVAIGEGSDLRAICVKRKVVVGNDVNIRRWIDSSGTLAVYDNCNIGVSATSADRITIGKNVRFKRLYSPMIQTGVYPENIMIDDFNENYKYEPHKEREIQHNIRSIKKGDLEDDVFPYSVVTKHDLEVYNNLIIDGDLSSSKDIVIMGETIVYGSIFAEGNIYLRKNCRVIGNIFAQGDIIFDDGAKVGSRLNTVSVLSRRNIELAKNNIVYGFINAEGGGITDKQYAEMRHDEKYKSAPSLVVDVEYDFNVVDFATFDKLALRKNGYLKKVTFNNDDKVIDRSILFGCENIEEVVVPNGLQTIEDFAFAELTSLKKIDLSKCNHLKYIGNEVFRKCESLETIIIPDSVEFIGEAAFIGCTNLKKVILSSNNSIIHVGNYAFSACGSLDRSFINKVNDVDEEKIFVEAKTSSDDSDVRYFDDISRDSEAALPNVYGRADEDDYEDYSGPEEKRRLTNEKQILAFKETPIGLYFAIAIVAIVVLLNVDPHIKNIFTKLLPVEEKESITEFLYTGTDAPPVDIYSKSTEVIANNDEYYVYDDRILKKFVYLDRLIEVEVEGLTELLTLIPEDISKYYMLVPGSISADLKARTESNDRSKEMIDNIYLSIPETFTTIDVYDELTSSSDYYFYKTHNSWTSRGAYIGYTAFADSIGFDVNKMEDYIKRATTYFQGNLYREIGDLNDQIEEYDLVETYMLPNQVNLQFVTKDEVGEPPRSFSTPLISTLRSGYQTFMGTKISQSIIEGNVSNNKTLLMIASSTGYPLTPYIADHYETIIFINPIYYVGIQSDFIQLFDDYQIDDVFVVESIHDLYRVRPERVKAEEAN